MQMGTPSKWVEHPVAKGEIFHVATFHLKLAGGKLVEVTQPAPEPK